MVIKLLVTKPHTKPYFLNQESSASFIRPSLHFYILFRHLIFFYGKKKNRCALLTSFKHFLPIKKFYLEKIFIIFFEKFVSFSFLFSITFVYCVEVTLMPTVTQKTPSSHLKQKKKRKIIRKTFIWLFPNNISSNIRYWLLYSFQLFY